MLQNTKAIILHTTKYSDNATIVHAYTEEFGRISYIANGRKGKKGGVSTALTQPLSIVDLVVEHQERRDLQRIKESRLASYQSTVSLDMYKNALAFFTAEILYRVLKLSVQDKALFQFLLQSIYTLNAAEKSVANFHLLFLLQLTRFMGFYPNRNNCVQARYFDLANGVFCNSEPAHSYVVRGNLCRYLETMLLLNYDTMEQLKLSRKERNDLLELLIEYYHIQLQERFTLKSPEVLKTLFD